MNISNLSDSQLLAQQQAAEEQRKATLRILEQSLVGIAPVTNAQLKETRSPEVKAAADAYEVESAKHIEVSKQISAAAPDYLAQAFQYNDQVKQQLEADKVIKLQAAELGAKVAQAALPEQQKAVDRYKDVVTDDDSTKRYQSLQASVQEQQAKIAQTEQDYANGNVFQKMGAALKLSVFRETLSKRQAALDYETRNRIQATQLLGEDLAAAQTTAGVVYAQEGIQIKQKAAASEILLDNLAKNRANLQTTVGELSAIHGLSSASSKALAEQLGVLNSQKIADTQAYINILSLTQQKNQVELSNENLRKVRGNKRTEDFWTQSVWPAFQATSEKFKDLDGEAVLNMSPEMRQKMGLDVPLAAFTQMFMHGVQAPFSGVQLAMQANQELTPMQKSVLSMAPTVVNSYNDQQRQQYIAGQVAKGRTKSDVEQFLNDNTTADFKALQNALLNPDDVNDWNKMDNLLRTELNSMSKDSTMAWQSGSVSFPSLQESLASPQIAQQLAQLVPDDIKEYIKSGELNAINTRIQKYEDFQRLEKELIAKAITSIAPVRDPITGGITSGASAPAAALADLRKASQALSAHMKVQREAVMRLSNPLIQNVKVRAPRVGLGASGEMVVDYENPEVLYKRLETSFLEQFTKQNANWKISGG